MSDALDPQTLADFRAEIGEHLDAIETAALAAETDRNATDALFRAFHSIKGLARILGDGSLETLTHAAESLLGTVRSGTRPFDNTMRDAIIAALDESRRLAATLGQARQVDDTVPVRARLEALCTSSAEGITPTQTTLVSPADDPWRWVTDDADLFAALLELIEETMPALAETAVGGRQAACDELDTLDHAFTRLNLAGAAALLGTLRAAESDDRMPAYAALLRAIEQLFSFVDRRPHPPEIVPPADEDAWIDDIEAAVLPDGWTVPAGLEAAYVDVRVATIGRARATAFAEGFLSLPDTTELEDVLGRLAEAEAIVAARSHVLDGSQGLALLIDCGAGTPDARLDALELPGEIRVVSRIDAGHPTRLFAPPSPTALPVTSPEDTQVRVPIDVLDKLFGRIGEFFTISTWLNVLVMDGGMRDMIGRLREHAATHAPEIATDVEALARLHRDFSSVEAEVSRLVSLIHESTLGLRVIPLSALVGRFPRMLRDVARETGKSIRFETQTGGIKIDKGMSEMLADPLMHILRNAVDHGVEPTPVRLACGKSVPALLKLDAVQSGNRIQITISDDGRGIDIERVRRKAVALRLVSEEESLALSPQQIARFIFAAGFSTTDSVSTISGRGIGMDVVLVNVTRLGGRIDIETTPAIGTRFRLDMPLSAAIQPMLLIETTVQTIGFPEAMIVEATSVPRASIQSVNGQRAVLFQDRFLPIFDLATLLNLPGGGDVAPGMFASLIVGEWGDMRIGIEVHRILRRHEMLIRETHPRVTRLPGIGGVTTLGFDRIVLVVDPDELFDLARHAATSGLVTHPERLTVEEGASA